MKNQKERYLNHHREKKNKDKKLNIFSEGRSAGFNLFFAKFPDKK